MTNIYDLAEKMMVDTIGLRILDIQPTGLKRKSKLEVEGKETEWAKGNLVTGAGKKSLQVTAMNGKKELRIEGSVALLKQDHNIVSSGDVTMLAYTAVQECNRGLALSVLVDRAAQFVRGQGMGVTRIDSPVLMKKPAGLMSSTVINAMALAGMQAGLNVSVYVNETVYFDQFSQSAALKGYDKLAEVKSKTKLAIPQTANTEMLMALARDTIRLEPVYRQKALYWYFDKEGLLPPCDFTPDVLANLLMRLLDRYDLRRDIRKPLNEEQLWEIPRKYRLAVMAWQSGYNVLKAMGGSETEYSRMASYLKNHHSLNIKGPPPMEDITERIELGDLLSPENFIAVPAQIMADPALFFTRDMDAERQRIDGLYAERFPQQT